MRWFRRRRRPDYTGRHRPGAWAEVALPPAEDVVVPPPAGPVVAPAAREVPVRRGRRVDVPSRVATPILGGRQRVRIGFSDGSSFDIEDDTRESEELRRIAARLIDDPR